MSQFESEPFDAGGGEAEPFDYDPEFRADLDRYIDEKSAPWREFVAGVEQEAALARGEDRAAELFAAESARAGVEVDTPAAIQAINEAFMEAAQLMVASGMPLQEVEARLFTEEAAELAIRLHVDGVARDKSAKGGDELSLVKKYFPTSRPGREPVAGDEMAVVRKHVGRAG